MLSTITQSTILVSKTLVLVIVKLVLATLDVLKNPCVPPADATVRKILLLAVTEVLATVTAPDDRVA